MRFGGVACSLYVLCEWWLCGCVAVLFGETMGLVTHRGGHTELTHHAASAGPRFTEPRATFKLPDGDSCPKGTGQPTGSQNQQGKNAPRHQQHGSQRGCVSAPFPPNNKSPPPARLHHIGQAGCSIPVGEHSAGRYAQAISRWHLGRQLTVQGLRPGWMWVLGGRGKRRNR